MEAFIKHVAEAIEGTEAEALRPEIEFKALPTWDSLARLTLTDTIDMEYGVLLKKEEMDACTTVADLYACVQARQDAGT